MFDRDKQQDMLEEFWEFLVDEGTLPDYGDMNILIDRFLDYFEDLEDPDVYLDDEDD